MNYISLCLEGSRTSEFEPSDRKDIMINTLRWYLFTIKCAFIHYRFRMRIYMWFKRNNDYPPADKWLDMMN